MLLRLGDLINTITACLSSELHLMSMVTASWLALATIEIVDRSRRVTIDLEP